MILLILPLAAFGIRNAERESATEIRIAVYADAMPAAVPGTWQETETSPGELLPLEQRLVNRLVELQPERTGSLFRYVLCGSEQQVKEEVASRRAECGYVFGAGLRERLERNDFKRVIRVYSAPSTVAARLSAEVVFSWLMELYDQELLVNYVEQGPVFAQEALSGAAAGKSPAHQAEECYEKWLHNGSTFAFVSEYSGDSRLEEASGAGNGIFPVRGIVAVYLFLVGLYGAVMNLNDEKKGLFLAIPYQVRLACRMASLAAPVALAGLSGLAALWSGGCLTRPGKELLAMAGYLAAVVVCSWILCRIAPGAEVLCGLIPCFLVGSLLFCPVILDVGRYIPALAPVQRLFLPWYYLRLFL